MSFVGISDLLSSASGFTSSDVGGEGKKKKGLAKILKTRHISKWNGLGIGLI